MGKTARVISIVVGLWLAGCTVPPSVIVQRCPAIAPSDELACEKCPPWRWTMKPQQIELLEDGYDESKIMYLECRARADACFRRERVWAESWANCGE